MKRCSGEIYLVDGRLVSTAGDFVFTDRVFHDPWDAAVWLALDDDGRLFGAWLSFDWEGTEGYGYESARTL
jgi:hypothetical protein